MELLMLALVAMSIGDLFGSLRLHRIEKRLEEIDEVEVHSEPIGFSVDGLTGTVTVEMDNGKRHRFIDIPFADKLKGPYSKQA